MDVLILLIALGLILVCAEVFTNGIENFGKSLGFSQAVIGSVFAAIGTALPETIIPLVAILMYGGESGKSIGIGAILGAPFMLTTMGLFLVGIGVFCSYFLKRRKTLYIHLEPQTFKRDFSFFLISYSIGVFLSQSLSSIHLINYFIAMLLLLNYIFYLYLTFKAKSASLETEEKLYFVKILEKLISLRNKNKAIMVFLSFFQTIFALIFMIEGAHLFVEKLESISTSLGMDPLIFSLLIAPIATELPEKFNSFIWTLKGRDILALGNMTGAMVFQSTFPVSIGLLFTNWKISGLPLIAATIAVSLGFFYLLIIKILKRLPPQLFLLSGIIYIIYGSMVVKTLLK